MGLFDGMEWDRMTDNGMWVWAGILTAVGLAASWIIAVAWLRWKEDRKRDQR